MNKMEIREILDYLPHRFPFLLIDRVLELEEGKRIVAVKNVAINEPFFQGHFPGNPVMPGVMILEALAQAAAILSFRNLHRESTKELLYYFVGIDNARFKKPVIPGDQLILNVSMLRQVRGIGKFAAHATVDGVLAVGRHLGGRFLHLGGGRLGLRKPAFGRPAPAEQHERAQRDGDDEILAIVHLASIASLRGRDRGLGRPRDGILRFS